MYKLILVDDEEEVRKGVLKKIEWEKYGFEIVGEAENGREALDMVERTFPDLVITDIKMPFMNGIELAEYLKEKSPTTKVIILTGFDEFEYAHKAIKLNVIEYVLKPISARELIEVLIKTKALLDEEIMERKNIEALRENYVRSLPLLKEKFLAALITNTMSKAEIEERAKNYNIDLNGNNFVVSTVRVENHSYQASYEEKELFAFALLNVINEIISKYDVGTAFMYGSDVVIICVFKNIEKEASAKRALKILEELQLTIKKYINLSVTIAVGNFCPDVTLISNSYKNSLTALDYRVLLGTDRIIWIEDVEPKSNDRLHFDSAKEHALSSSLKVGTEEDINKTIDEFFNEISSSKASIKDYQIYLMEIITAILKVAKASDINLSEILAEGYNLFTDLFSFNDLIEIKTGLKNLCIKIMEKISLGRQDTSKSIVKEAKEYIESHYMESDLGINDLCSFLHISPTYFSSIFKKETKMTFVNYLTQVRMNAAKELLKTTNLKAFEIAEKVGYSEPNYFSYSFKKNFGISPSEFRSKSL
ncbi:response regulator [Clostridium thermarum]|uniref:response regulator n=1 Tax=Clostridium thermarum TaxID=1716543 RepID=UPI0013D21F46|nr:response regulator [Clostridium thermarum]